MIENNNDLINKFTALAVDNMLYKSKNKLLFRAKQVFGDIDLKDKSMLELGCGDGVYSIWAKINGAKRVIGLEPEVDGSTSGSAKIFTELINNLNLDNIDCLPQTIENFNPNGIKFDIVLSNMSINHFDENACIKLNSNLDAQRKYLGIFNKVKSTMKPRGKFIILDNSNKNFFGIFKKRSPFCPNINWRKHQPPKVWIKLLKQAGFGEAKISWPSRYCCLLSLYCHNIISYFIDSFFRIEVTLLEVENG
ncbi:MAG: class I SAM-dependent methyltransferase [Candidatus Omnitrophota bacterium]|nr:class I SAM-dependent methyltransferase [Candidatus Omnitrophota bacterium]